MGLSCLCGKLYFLQVFRQRRRHSALHRGVGRRHYVFFAAGLPSLQYIDPNRIPQTRRANMSEQDKTNGNESNNDMTRRTTLTLAAAVATFGAAMGMRAPTASA